MFNWSEGIIKLCTESFTHFHHVYTNSALQWKEVDRLKEEMKSGLKKIKMMQEAT